MIVTVLKRYDLNGAWTHDISLRDGDFKPNINSMYRVAGYIDINLDDYDIKDSINDLNNRVMKVEETTVHRENNWSVEIRTNEDYFTVSYQEVPFMQDGHYFVSNEDGDIEGDENTKDNSELIKELISIATKETEGKNDNDIVNLKTILDSLEPTSELYQSLAKTINDILH